MFSAKLFAGGWVFRFFFLILFFSVSVSASEAGIVIVVNKSVRLNSFSSNFARQIFGMKTRQWPDGAAVKVFVMPDRSEQHLKFSKEILGTFPYRLRSAWDRQVYSGTGQAPYEVISEDEMLELVSQTPGAIGYLPRKSANSADLHVVEIR